VGNDDEEDIALSTPSTLKLEVAVKRDATLVILEHVPADGNTFDNENENGQAHRYRNTDPTLEFPRALL
jgi:hypothetical protein